MKRILLVLIACFPVIGLMAAEVESLAGDTIITLERKRIEVKENGDRMKVRVYEVDEDGLQSALGWFWNGFREFCGWEFTCK